MGLNVLGARKVRRIAEVTGEPIVWAVVKSHEDSGRQVYLTTADHRHGMLDRLTGDWYIDAEHISPYADGDTSCRQTSCPLLFRGDPDAVEVQQRARVLRVAVSIAGVPGAIESQTTVG